MAPRKKNGEDDKALREHLLQLLHADNAHVDFETGVKAFPTNLQGKRPPGAAHSPWEVLEHMRIAQWDILEFTRNPEHKSPVFPKGYWPASAAPPDKSAWSVSVRRFRADLRSLGELVADPSNDLQARLPYGDGQTILREVLLAADHNAYHLGELMLLRRMLGAWR